VGRDTTRDLLNNALAPGPTHPPTQTLPLTRRPPLQETMNYWKQTTQLMGYFKEENFRSAARLPSSFMHGFLEVSPLVVVVVVVACVAGPAEELSTDRRLLLLRRGGIEGAYIESTFLHNPPSLLLFGSACGPPPPPPPPRPHAYPVCLCVVDFVFFLPDR
jgi:hypothetical protein